MSSSSLGETVTLVEYAIREASNSDGSVLSSLEYNNKINQLLNSPDVLEVLLETMGSSFYSDSERFFAATLANNLLMRTNHEDHAPLYNKAESLLLFVFDIDNELLATTVACVIAQIYHFCGASVFPNLNEHILKSLRDGEHVLSSLAVASEISIARFPLDYNILDLLEGYLEYPYLPYVLKIILHQGIDVCQRYFSLVADITGMNANDTALVLKIASVCTYNENPDPIIVNFIIQGLKSDSEHIVIASAMAFEHNRYMPYSHEALTHLYHLIGYDSSITTYGVSLQAFNSLKTYFISHQSFLQEQMFQMIKNDLESENDACVKRGIRAFPIISPFQANTADLLDQILNFSPDSQLHQDLMFCYTSVTEMDPTFRQSTLQFLFHVITFGNQENIDVALSFINEIGFDHDADSRPFFKILVNLLETATSEQEIVRYMYTIAKLLECSSTLEGDPSAELLLSQIVNLYLDLQPSNAMRDPYIHLLSGFYQALPNKQPYILKAIGAKYFEDMISQSDTLALAWDLYFGVTVIVFSVEDVSDFARSYTNILVPCLYCSSIGIVVNAWTFMAKLIKYYPDVFTQSSDTVIESLSEYFQESTHADILASIAIFMIELTAMNFLIHSTELINRIKYRFESLIMNTEDYSHQNSQSVAVALLWITTGYRSNVENDVMEVICRVKLASFQATDYLWIPILERMRAEVPSLLERFEECEKSILLRQSEMEE